MEIGKMTITEAEPYLESVAMLYGLNLGKVKHFRFARMILATLYCREKRMTHKEFYIWLQGYLYGKLDDGNVSIKPIIQKMELVKEDNKINISEPNKISFPIPVNPFPVKEDPYSPPFEVYCGDKQQLND